MRFILPDNALVQHIAVTGKSGSGKTNAAKVMVERFLTEKRRVCILDPTGAWWGLQSNEKGSKAMFKLTIFGGAHGNFPLSEKHGALLAELIATTDLPCIIDTSEMGANERTRFMADFAEMLYKKNASNPLHLVMDEAHEFAPQMPRTPQAGIMLNAVERMVTGGRVRGFRVIMITQRPAALNKSVLTQVETLIAFRMTGAPDRHAIEDWIAANADKQTGKEILQSLAGLPTGEGWVWVPESGILERWKFPKSATYDSGKAPTGEQVKVVLATIDHAEIEKRLGKVAAEVADNDPKRLRARIAELEKNKGKPDAEALRVAEEAGYTRAVARIQAEVKEAVGQAAARLRALADDLAGSSGLIPVNSPPRGVPASSPVKLPATNVKQTVSRSMDGVTGPQQRVLDAMARLTKMGVSTLHKVQVAAVAGVKPSSGSFGNNLGRLRTLGLIDYPQPGILAFTNAGSKAANHPEDLPSVGELHTAWLGLVTAPQAKILRVLLDRWPEHISKGDLGAAIGVHPTSGSFGNNLGRLRTLGVIDYPAPGVVRAEDILFPDQ